MLQLPVDQSLGDLSHAVQLAITPVFLLSGVAAFLNVLNSRLSRVIDRSRVLESRSGETDPEDDAEKVILLQRRHSINYSITLCTICAILISLVVLLFFVGLVVHVEVGKSVAVLFIGSMLALIAGLFAFLHEIHLALRFFRRAALP